jgi:hypothetical protein
VSAPRTLEPVHVALAEGYCADILSGARLRLVSLSRRRVNIRSMTSASASGRPLYLTDAL